MANLAKLIGPTFGLEVEASALHGLPFSWGPDGIFYADGALTPDQVTTLGALVQAHDPSKQLPAVISFEAFLGLLTTSEQMAMLSATDMTLRLFIIKATGAGEINLGDPQVSEGLNYASKSLGILTDPRVVSILANQPHA